MYSIYFSKHPSHFMKKTKTKNKAKDLSIKMLHVINNSLATSDGFTGYSVGFGIRCERKQQGPGCECPQPEHCGRSVGWHSGAGGHPAAGRPAGSPSASHACPAAPARGSLESESWKGVLRESLRFCLGLPLGGRRAERQQRSGAVGGATSPPAAHPLHSSAQHRFRVSIIVNS